MKNLLLILGAGSLCTSCAGVRVSNVQTAAVVTERPHYIYIKPFSVEGAEFTGYHSGGAGERPIRESLAPAEFSQDLKEELERLAPARVLLPDEIATEGWVVEGTIDKVHAGNPLKRALSPPYGSPFGHSKINIHVRVRDLSHAGEIAGAKDQGTLRRHGHVIYEFDLDGGSRWSGPWGNTTSPSLGYATPFDYRNAAERVRAALEPDAHRYGYRSSPTIR